jgi:hypothetical protein
VYERLLRRSDLAHAHPVIRATAMTQLARIDSDSIRSGSLPTLAALARAEAFADAEQLEAAKRILAGLPSRAGINDDDLSHTLRLHAAVSDEHEALGLLFEHAALLPDHQNTPGVLAVGVRVAASTLRSDTSKPHSVDQAIRFMRMIRDDMPSADPTGGSRALLATALMREPRNTQRLLEAASTWAKLDPLQTMAAHASINRVCCLIASSQICAATDKDMIGARLLAACDEIPQEVHDQRRALVAAGQTIANSLTGEIDGCVHASGSLLLLQRVSPPEDAPLVALAIDSRCRALLEIKDLERCAETVSFAVGVLPDHAGPIVTRIAIEARAQLDAHAHGFFADAHPMPSGDACARALSEALRWSAEHDQKMHAPLSLALAHAQILSGDSSAALRTLDTAAETTAVLHARAESLFQQGDAEQAFGAYRSLTEHLDSGRTYNTFYFSSWVRMLEILSTQPGEHRRTEVARETERLLSIDSISAHPACTARLRSLQTGAAQPIQD